MIVVMSRGATPAQVESVCDRIKSLGYAPHL